MAYCRPKKGEVDGFTGQYTTAEFDGIHGPIFNAEPDLELAYRRPVNGGFERNRKSDHSKRQRAVTASKSGFEFVSQTRND